MKECSKSIARRLNTSQFATRYFSGDGVDIGGKPDPLALYQEFFPLMRSIKTWDLEHGDAQLMQGVPDDHFDFVHSSHCLEHLRDPVEGMRNWLRITKPDGYLVITLPDEDLYEQGVFPSTFNRDHKHTFTIWKASSWSPASINVLDLVRSLGAEADIVKLELLASSYRFKLPRFDQTLTPVGECGIEIIVRKRRQEELTSGGRSRNSDQPPPEVRAQLNQHRMDLDTLKAANTGKPPFQNTDPI